MQLIFYAENFHNFSTTPPIFLMSECLAFILWTVNDDGGNQNNKDKEKDWKVREKDVVLFRDKVGHGEPLEYEEFWRAELQG